jgi:hypothetical protein
MHTIYNNVGDIIGFDGTKIIMGAISIVIGLVLLPLMASFSAATKADANVSAVSGLTSLIDLVLYGFTFGLVGLGIGLIYVGFRK